MNNLTDINGMTHLLKTRHLCKHFAEFRPLQGAQPSLSQGMKGIIYSWQQH